MCRSNSLYVNIQVRTKMRIKLNSMPNIVSWFYMLDERKQSSQSNL